MVCFGIEYARQWKHEPVPNNLNNETAVVSMFRIVIYFVSHQIQVATKRKGSRREEVFVGCCSSRGGITRTTQMFNFCYFSCFVVILWFHQCYCDSGGWEVCTLEGLLSLGELTAAQIQPEFTTVQDVSHGFYNFFLLHYFP